MEIRGVFSHSDPGLTLPASQAGGVRALLCGFIARAIARFLGRPAGRARRGAGASVTLALLAIGFLGGTSVHAQNRVGLERIRAELAELGVFIQSDTNGVAARANDQLDDEGLSKLGPLLVSLGKVRALNLSET